MLELLLSSAGILIVVCVGFITYCCGRTFGSSSSTSTNSGFKSSALYKRHYSSSRQKVPLPSSTKARGSAQGMPECKFFLSAKSQLQRDYILIIDRSGSMGGGRRWSEACKAVKTLAPYVCKFDPDGISLFFFDHSVEKFDTVKSADEVERLFDRYRPRGSTNLARALHDAFCEHFDGSRGATTILVVTDGCPDSQSEVERVLRKAANSIEEDDELSVSFVQIGDDPGASRYLEHLDDSLDGAKYDIVDTITSEECSRISFAELVARSIYD